MATWEPRAKAAKARTSVAGGHTIRSVRVTRSGEPSMILVSSAAEPFRPFIFQLPAMSGRGALAITHLALSNRRGAVSRAFAATPGAAGRTRPMLRYRIGLLIRMQAWTAAPP